MALWVCLHMILVELVSRFQEGAGPGLVGLSFYIDVPFDWMCDRSFALLLWCVGACLGSFFGSFPECLFVLCTIPATSRECIDEGGCTVSMPIH